MRKIRRTLFLSALFVFIGIIIFFLYQYFHVDKLPPQSIVYIVPVYGQSLALGEEANLITDVDSYAAATNNRVKSEFLNDKIGYYADKLCKQRVKSMLCISHRHFESSVFGLGESFVKQFEDNNIILVTFPSGQGETEIARLGKGSVSYNKLLEEIKMVYDKAKSQGAKVVVPAFCWMQGENDLVWDTKDDYAALLVKFRKDLESDIKEITHQTIDVNCILYQTNCLSLAKDSLIHNNYETPQMRVPEIQRNLIISNPHFYASGPVYPYNVMREYVHIDGIGQKQMGWLSGITLRRMIDGKKFEGLQPKAIRQSGDTLKIDFIVPYPPLTLDTITVNKVINYGFSVITKDNRNILKEVLLKDSVVMLVCDIDTMPIESVKVKYGVCGGYMKSGRINGPRGNLRDSQGLTYQCKINGMIYPLNNWCYFFELN